MENGHWTFLTNHGHVILAIAEQPEARLRDIAARVQITERAVQRIVHDLLQDGYIEAERVGRRNRYKVHREFPLRHPTEADRTVGALIDLLRHDREPSSE